MEYRGSGEYTLIAVNKEGKTLSPVHASCQVVEEEVEQGVGLGNLVLTGFLEEKRLVNNIATVGNKLHIFTSVSCALI